MIGSISIEVGDRGILRDGENGIMKNAKIAKIQKKCENCEDLVVRGDGVKMTRRCLRSLKIERSERWMFGICWSLFVIVEPLSDWRRSLFDVIF
jgi:hypothetical protein